MSSNVGGIHPVGWFAISFVSTWILYLFYVVLLPLLLCPPKAKSRSQKISPAPIRSQEEQLLSRSAAGGTSASVGTSASSSSSVERQARVPNVNQPPPAHALGVPPISSPRPRVPAMALPLAAVQSGPDCPAPEPKGPQTPKTVARGVTTELAKPQEANQNLLRSTTPFSMDACDSPRRVFAAQISSDIAVANASLAQSASSSDAPPKPPQAIPGVPDGPRVPSKEVPPMLSDETWEVAMLKINEWESAPQNAWGQPEMLRKSPTIDEMANWSVASPTMAAMQRSSGGAAASANLLAIPTDNDSIQDSMADGRSSIGAASDVSDEV